MLEYLTRRARTLVLATLTASVALALLQLVVVPRSMLLWSLFCIAVYGIAILLGLRSEDRLDACRREAAAREQMAAAFWDLADSGRGIAVDIDHLVYEVLEPALKPLSRRRARTR